MTLGMSLYFCAPLCSGLTDGHDDSPCLPGWVCEQTGGPACASSAGPCLLSALTGELAVPGKPLRCSSQSGGRPGATTGS